MSNSHPISWAAPFLAQLKTAENAIRLIRPGARVFIGSCAGVPQTLVEALGALESIRDLEIIHILTLGHAPYMSEDATHRFRHNALFIGDNVRDAVSAGRADYTPICLSEIPELFRSGHLALDVALISVSPPDRHGYCSYGVSCDIVKTAAESAQLVIAEVNEQMPRLLGNCTIHCSDIDVMVAADRPLPEAPAKKPDPVARRIAQKVACLVDNGATLQIGIGSIPNAVLSYLQDREDLGIHTEVLTDGVIPLVKSGIINNSLKERHRGKIVTSFVMGSRELYDFVDDNPIIECQPTEYVNDPLIIAQLDRMVSINSALEVDLTGQVCSDSIGTAFYSGVGSQTDFARGAAHSKGGKPIIALRSTACNETMSRIVPCLKPGAGVVTGRSDVRYVVTEYGTAYLHGKSMRARALELIQCAHPRFRPWLLSEAKARKLVYHDQVELPVSTPQYPETLESWIQLKDDSRVFMRPLKLTDESLLRELFYKLSPDSVRSRFFAMLPAMPHEKLQEFLRVDYSADMAVVVLTDDSQNAQLIGCSHYRTEPKTRFADASFLVRDDWQGRGMAGIMARKLIEIAQANGITGFTADVLRENHGMMHVFQRCGFPVETTFEDGVYNLRIPFVEPKPKRRRKPQRTAPHTPASAVRES